MIFKKNKGITIFEVLITITILAILLIVGLPSFQNTKHKNILKSSVAEVASAIDKARSQSISSINSSEYGVHFEASKAVIFTGIVYSAGSSSNEDVSIASPGTISAISLTGGATELYFDRLSGEPSKTGTVTITVGSFSETITINATGTVSSS